jgi:hypothetical protein
MARTACMHVIGAGFDRVSSPYHACMHFGMGGGGGKGREREGEVHTGVSLPEAMPDSSMAQAIAVGGPGISRNPSMLSYAGLQHTSRDE